MFMFSCVRCLARQSTDEHETAFVLVTWYGMCFDVVASLEINIKGAASSVFVVPGHDMRPFAKDPAHKATQVFPKVVSLLKRSEATKSAFKKAMDRGESLALLPGGKVGAAGGKSRVDEHDSKMFPTPSMPGMRLFGSSVSLSLCVCVCLCLCCLGQS